MINIRPLLLVALLLGMVGAARADTLPVPLESSDSGSIARVSSVPADPSFNSDVERSLSDLTKLQCSMLSLMLLNPQPCPSR